jgi:hypothetical protein
MIKQYDVVGACFLFSQKCVSLFFTAVRGDFEQADRFGNLAIQIFNKYESKEWQARVGGNVYGGIYPMTHPYRESLQPLLAAHRAGLILGDIHVSFRR